MITNELLLRFKNNLGFSGAIAHTWDDKFAISGAKIGDTLRLRDAVEFTVGKNPDITSAIQDVVETQKTLTLNQQAVVAFNFSSAELTLSIDAFSDRYLKSAAVALANQVDVDGLTMAYQSTGNQVGTPGTPIASLDPFWIAGETLDTFSAPMDGKRTMCISPKVQTAALKAAQGLFQSSNQVKQQYERGRMGTMGGFEWVMDQNVTHAHRRPARRRSAGRRGQPDGIHARRYWLHRRRGTAPAEGRLVHAPDSISCQSRVQ